MPLDGPQTAPDGPDAAELAAGQDQAAEATTEAVTAEPVPLSMAELAARGAEAWQYVTDNRSDYPDAIDVAVDGQGDTRLIRRTETGHIGTYARYETGRREFQAETGKTCPPDHIVRRRDGGGWEMAELPPSVTWDGQRGWHDTGR